MTFLGQHRDLDAAFASIESTMRNTYDMLAHEKYCFMRRIESIFPEDSPSLGFHQMQEDEPSLHVKIPQHFLDMALLLAFTNANSNLEITQTVLQGFACRYRSIGSQYEFLMCGIAKGLLAAGDFARDFALRITTFAAQVFSPWCSGSELRCFAHCWQCAAQGSCEIARDADASEVPKFFVACYAAQKLLQRLGEVMTVDSGMQNLDAASTIVCEDDSLHLRMTFHLS